MTSTGIPPNRSRRRSQLLTWFRAKAAPLADAYEGAVKLLEDEHFPGRVHFIAHAVRDISDRLVYVLDPHRKSSRVQYENELDRIMELWPRLQSIRDVAETQADLETISIDYRLASIVDALVELHRERRGQPSNYELLFRFLMRNESAQGDVNRRIVDEFKTMRDWFMKLTHLRANEAPRIDETQLKGQFNKFEGMLHSFVGDFFTGTAELDEILQQANR